MTKNETIRHCGYCSEGYDGKCDGVYCDPCACSEWVIKRLEDQNAKLLADWRRMREELQRIEGNFYYDVDGKPSPTFLGSKVHKCLSSLSYQDSPTQ